MIDYNDLSVGGSGGSGASRIPLGIHENLGKWLLSRKIDAAQDSIPMMRHFLSRVRDLEQMKTEGKSRLEVTKDVVNNLRLWLLPLVKANQSISLKPHYYDQEAISALLPDLYPLKVGRYSLVTGFSS
jgi:hypothetical protein